MRKAQATSNIWLGAKAHSGIRTIPRIKAVIMALRRPHRSDRCPTTIPPMMAPTPENAVIAERRIGL
jgi:hypothetical protein